MTARIIQTNDAPLSSVDVDGVTVDIIENALRNAREEMDAVLFRTAMSPGIREQGDCFPMIANREGKMVVGQFGSFIGPFLEAYDEEIEEGDIILTSLAEYSSNYLAFLQVREKHGVRVKVIKNDQFGQLDLADLESSLKKGAKLVAINHIPTNSGLVNPAEEIGHLTRKYGTLFLLDACQSVGQYPLDVSKINCDILSATGRKFLRGPRGTGFLYVNRDLIKDLIPPFLDLHSASWNTPDEYTIRADARRFENWESNYALRMGLQEAAEYAMGIGLENIRSRVSRLASELRSQLREIPRVTVHDRGRELCGIVTLSVEGVSSERVKEHLAQRKINVSITDRTGALLDMMDKGLDSAIRASVHYYNTIDEINTFIVHIKSLSR